MFHTEQESKKVDEEKPIGFARWTCSCVSLSNNRVFFCKMIYDFFLVLKRDNFHFPPRLTQTKHIMSSADEKKDDVAM